jgi:hypothetical protein
VCEPIGSFLIDHYAPKLLTIDPKDPAYVKSNIDAEESKDEAHKNSTVKVDVSYQTQA